jgi:hypothetical protein
VSVAGGQRPAIEFRLLPCAACLTLSSPLSLPFLLFPLSRRGSSSSATGHGGERGVAERRRGQAEDVVGDAGAVGTLLYVGMGRAWWCA